MKKKTIVLIIILSLFLHTLSGCVESDDKGEDFEFMTIDGEIKYLSDYRGKVVILDMWATWCGYCQYQMLELKKVYDSYSRNELEIISIDIDPGETPQMIQSFMKWFKANYGVELNWVFGIDNGNVWNKYKMEQEGVPAICIFDQKGNLRFSREGVSTFSELASKIDSLL